MSFFGLAKDLDALAVAFVLSAITMTGCAGHAAKGQMNSAPTEQVTTKGIDAADVKLVTDEAVTSLLASGVLNHVGRTPAVLVFDAIANQTSQWVDTEILVDRLRAALVSTGKIVTAERGAPGTSDFTMSGRVAEMHARSANIDQSTYMFSFTLADTNRLTVWAESKSITKQTSARQPSF